MKMFENQNELITMIKKGPDVWNKFKKENEGAYIDLGSIDFERDIKEVTMMYDLPEYHDYDFSGCRLNSVVARNSIFFDCDFSSVTFTFSDICYSSFYRCKFINTELAVSRLGSAEFTECEFINCNLSYCSAEETKFISCNILNSNMNNMSLVKTDFSKSSIINTSVYGISSWDLILKKTVQENILISENDNLSVDNIEIAQFIYLMINNKKIRDILDTITSKVVLILGRFTKERKKVLDYLKKQLQQKGYVAVVFDFDKPSSRDLTETISTLAHLSKFVIADLTDAKSLPQELTTIIPNLPSVPIQPIILKGQREYGMYEHFQRYPWVNEIFEYEKDLKEIVKKIEELEFEDEKTTNR